MQQFYRVNRDTGLFVEPVLFDDGIIPVDEDIVLVNIPEGFHLPKWDKVGKKWVEGRMTTDLLDVSKKSKIAELNAKCNETILASFTSSALGVTHTYGFSYEDQQNLASMLSMFNADSTITTVDWKTKDAGILAHSKAQFLQICKDAQTHKQSNIVKYWTRKGQVESKTTTQEISSIVW